MNGKARNVNGFGRAFERAGLVWTPELCREDSDGDGLANGVELGDPDCVWKPGDVPAKESLTHPGFPDNPATEAAAGATSAPVDSSAASAAPTPATSTTAPTRDGGKDNGDDDDDDHEESLSATWILPHVLLMGIGAGLLLPAAVLAASQRISPGGAWRAWHMYTQTLVLALASAGMAVVLAVHPVDAVHGLVGVTAFALMAVQAVGGWTLMVRCAPSTRSGREWIASAHALVGAAGFLVAAAAIFLGYGELAERAVRGSPLEVGLQVGKFVHVGLAFVVVGVLALRARVKRVAEANARARARASRVEPDEPQPFQAAMMIGGGGGGQAPSSSTTGLELAHADADDSFLLASRGGAGAGGKPNPFAEHSANAASGSGEEAAPVPPPPTLTSSSSLGGIPDFLLPSPPRTARVVAPESNPFLADANNGEP